MKDVFRMMPELVDIIQVQSCTLFSISPDRKHVQIKLEYPTGQESHEISCMYVIQDHPYFDVDVLMNGTQQRGDYEYERINPSYILIKDPLNSRLSNDELKRYSSFRHLQALTLFQEQSVCTIQQGLQLNVSLGNIFR